MIAYHEAGAAQLRPDGTPWAFLILNAEGTAIGADTVSEIVDELIVEHADATDDDRFLLRLSLLSDLAEKAQAVALAAHRDADPELDGRLGEPGLTALVAPKLGVQLQMDVWPFEVPLYLLASQYAPYTDMPLPIGEHIVILDPSTERTVLDGLGALGAIDFCVYEPSMIEAAAS